VLDPAGKVVSRYFEESYRNRMTGTSFLLRLDGDSREPGAIARLTGAYLSASVGLSDSVVAPGQELTLIVDLELKPGIHVYAPGDHTYRVTTVELESDSLFESRDTICPEAMDYYFKPLDEHVPVFEGSVRLLKPVIFKATKETGALSREPGATVTLKAVLEYQACDDRVCFMPESIPIEMVIPLRPLEK